MAGLELHHCLLRNLFSCAFWVAHQPALGCCCRFLWMLSRTDQCSKAKRPWPGHRQGSGAQPWGQEFLPGWLFQLLHMGAPHWAHPRPRFTSLHVLPRFCLPQPCVHSAAWALPGSWVPPNCCFYICLFPSLQFCKVFFLLLFPTAQFASSAAPSAAAPSCQPPSPAPQGPSARQ